jgi:8-oxo-dGTP pyrophosphatase MutT (NUDIX family)
VNKIIPTDAVLIPDSANKVFTGHIFDVYQWSQAMFDDSEATFEMLKRPDTVVVLPIVDGQVMTIEDEQPHTDSRLGFPGGRVDNTDSTTLAAAQREIKEETGYEFKNWKLIRVIQPHVKLEWFIYYYLAWDESGKVEPHLDAGEKISIKMMDFDEAKKFLVTKSEYLGDSKEILEKLTDINQLLDLPEYIGKEVDDQMQK